MLDSSTIRWIAAFLIIGLPGSPATAEPFHSQSQNGKSAMETPAEFWLRNAWLVDPGDTTDPYLAHMRIADGRIAEILDARAAAADTQAEPPQPAVPSIDAQYRFLLPGFIDTHAHLSLGPVVVSVEDGQPLLKIEQDADVAPRSLRALLAHGITTVRDPGGDTETLVRLKHQLERDERIGPRLRVAGAVIDRQPFEGLTAQVDSPEEVRAEVRRQAEAGVDWIKLYTQLSREELEAGIDEAHAHGLKAVAHLQRIPWTDAAHMGLDGLVHVVPGSELLLPEASRAGYLPDLLGTRFLYSWFEHVDLESRQIREMIQSLKTSGTTLDLTLVAFEAMVQGDRAHRTRLSPDLNWAAPGLVENWRGLFTFNIGWQAEDFERARRAWPKTLQFARLLHASGVHLTVGTDANNPWTVPGPSFHRELELLAEAGIPNRDILRMATVNGAQSLDLEHEIGRIQPGSVADLVLLNRDPTIDISATRDLVWVMLGGRIHDPVDLFPTDRLAPGRPASRPARLKP